MDPNQYPTVSFIMPVRNEERTIKKCLDSLLALDYPKEKIEIVVAEGKSTDKTRKIVESYAKKHSNIKLFDEPTGNTAIGRNICMDNSRGEMLMNYSGHVIAEKNLLKELALKLSKMPLDIAGVGCSNVSPPKQNFVGKMAAIAFMGFMAGARTFFQNAVFDEERFVAHMAFTCYRKEIFDKVDKFDPEFCCGQDAELDIRIYKGGYKILYTPKTRVYHYKRNTIKSLFRQMYRYGIARVKMVKKHPETISKFHVLPSIFVLGVMIITLLYALSLIPLLIIAAITTLYVSLCIISTLKVTRNPLIIIASIFFYLLIQMGYGIGFIRGIFYDKL